MFGCCIKQHVDQINKYITSIKVTLKINYNYNKIKTDYWWFILIKQIIKLQRTGFIMFT